MKFRIWWLFYPKFFFIVLVPTVEGSFAAFSYLGICKIFSLLFEHEDLVQIWSCWICTLFFPSPFLTLASLFVDLTRKKREKKSQDNKKCGEVGRKLGPPSQERGLILIIRRHFAKGIFWRLKKKKRWLDSTLRKLFLCLNGISIFKIEKFL